MSSANGGRTRQSVASERTRLQSRVSALIAYEYARTLIPNSSGTFASGGSDGIVSIWDYKLKKRLRQYAKFHAAVTSVSFSGTGSKMAVGVGYLHEDGHGEKGSKSSIIIKSIDDAKVYSGPTKSFVDLIQCRVKENEVFMYIFYMFLVWYLMYIAIRYSSNYFVLLFCFNEPGIYLILVDMFSLSQPGL
jgi:hypothetical protein